MKIVLVTHFFPPDHIGGVEFYTFWIARDLIKLGHQVHVVCAENWGKGERHQVRWVDDTYEGIPVRRLYFNWLLYPNPFRSLYDNVQVGTHMRDYLSELQPDVMHVISSYSLSARPMLAAKELGIPVVLTLTDFWHLCPRHTLLCSDGTLCRGKESAWGCLTCHAGQTKAVRMIRRLPSFIAHPLLIGISRRPALIRALHLVGLVGDMDHRAAFLSEVLGMVDRIIAPSRISMELHLHNGAPRDTLVISSYGLDVTSAKNGRFKSPGTRLRIGYIGTLSPHKGTDVLIRAFRRLPAETPAELKIYGSLESNEQYATHLRELAGDDSRIAFLGTFPNEQIGEILAAIDVLVVPSVWYENTPLVIYSAFAAETPVIVTDLGGMSELIQAKVNGLLFQVGDAVDLARQLQLIVDQPDLLESLKKGIPPVKTVLEGVQELEQIYRTVVAGKEKDEKSL